MPTNNEILWNLGKITVPYELQCIQLSPRLPATKIDEIQITTNSKKMINVKYNHSIIKQNKLNKAMVLNFYKMFLIK
jgi:hypothetical protein